MEKYLQQFIPPSRILMGPGPSDVNPRVLHEMGRPVLGHLDPAFVRVMEDVVEMLQMVFGTSRGVTLPLSGTGTAGMEASFCNILEQGDVAVIARNGYFGTRMADIASRCGAEVHIVDYSWGSPVGPDLSMLEAELKKHASVKAIGIVHGETSTGVISPLTALSKIARNYDSVLIVDAVTSLGGHQVLVDEWGIDVCYSGTQKCLGAPPGLSPITFGPRAIKVIEERKTPVRSYYFDIELLRRYWLGTPPAYHHTVPISMIYGLREALRIVFEEGINERFLRHSSNANSLIHGLEALGLVLFSDEQYRLNPLTTVKVPETVDEAKVRSRLLREYNIEIGGGLGELSGKGWRIGLMGESSKLSNVLTLLSALERILPDEGHDITSGLGVSAAQAAGPHM